MCRLPHMLTSFDCIQCPVSVVWCQARLNCALVVIKSCRGGHRAHTHTHPKNREDASKGGEAKEGVGRCARRRAAREATWVDCCEVAAGHQLGVAVQSWRAGGRAQAPPARRRCCCGRGPRPEGRSAYAAKGLPAGHLGLAGNLHGADLLLTHGLQQRGRLGVDEVG